MALRLHILLPLLLGIAAVAHGVPRSAAAQPALTGESTLVNAAGPHAVALGGATTVFTAEVFDLALQPAGLGDADRFELGFASEHDRFPVRDTTLWSLGVLVPLQSLDRSLPGIAVVHRRLRADASLEATVLGLERRIELDYATDVTTLAAGWSLGADPRTREGRGGSLGVALHVVESGGVLRSTSITVLGDTTVTVAKGLDDLLFAVSVGAVGRWSVPVGASGSLQTRGGAVWRRAGEESDALSARLQLTNVGDGALDLLRFDETVVTHPIMASEVAFGVGLRWHTPSWTVTVQAELAEGVYPGAPEGTSQRWGTEVRLFDRIALRGGGVNDFRLRDLVAGVGVEWPLVAQWRLGADLAFEPARHPDTEVGDAMVWGVRLTGPLPHRSRTGPPEESLDELLDELDDWLDETSTSGVK